MKATALRRVCVLACGVTAILLAVAGPASAHVTVNPNQAVQGGFTKLTFRVPNEKDTASTVKLEVVVPTDKPIAFMSVKPVAGWTVAMDRTKLAAPVKTGEGEISEAVSKLTWTATGAESAIKPGQFQEFEVSAGPLPETDMIVFKALQTYSDGDIVRWIDEPSAGADAEHPAPVLRLSKGAATGPTVQTNDASGTAGTSGSNGAALAIGIIALVAALGALAFSFLTWRDRQDPHHAITGPADRDKALNTPVS